MFFGKGLRAYNHPGNIHYRQVIQNKTRDYDLATTRQEKDEIAYSVLPLIPGRFLTKVNDDCYQIVDQEMVINKIKQAIRDCKKKHPSKTVSNHKRKNRTDTKEKENSEPSDFRRNLHRPTSPVSQKDVKKLIEICKNLSS